MTVFDLSEIQANYILDMPLRRLTKFSRIELEAEQDKLRADDRRARPRSSTSDSLLRETVVRRARRGRQDSSARRGAPCCSSRPGAPATHDRRRSRSPTTRAGCCCRRPGCWPGPLDADPLPRRRSPGQARRRSSSAVRTTARGEVGVGDHGRPDAAAVACSTCRAAADRRRAAPVRRRAGRASSWPLDTRRAGARAGRASTPTVEPGWRSAPRRAWSSGWLPDYPANKDAWEVIALKDGDRVVGAVELATGERGAGASSPPTPSCCASRPPPCGRRGGPAGGMAGIRLGAGAPGRASSAPSTRRRDAVGGHGRRARPPRCRAPSRLGQGDAVRRVPRARAAPPAACAATGSCGARTS